MKEDTRTAVKHEFEHAAPTVIHDPEQDMTILARWLHRGMAQGPKFWYLLAGVVVVVVLLSMLAGGLAQGRSSVGRGWTELGQAQTPSQKIEVANSFPGTEVARVARLQAATDYFFTATRDLPGNRETALPQLQKALQEFQQVAKEAPKDSPEARAAALGAARTLEARNELPEAIEAYKAVASGWPGTAEAQEAQAFADRLKDPEAVAFYKELYTYKAPSASLPSSLPGFPADHPPLTGPTVPAGPLSTPTSDLLKSLTNPAPGSTRPPGPAPFDLAPPPLTPPDSKTEATSRPVAPASARPEPPAAKTGSDAKDAAPPGANELPKDPFTPATKPKS